MGPALAGVLLAAASAAAPAVRAWEGTEVIPTYEEGPPDVNPPFDLFSGSRFNYPYTLRTALTDRRAPRAWRTLDLENEYLRVTVLPDLGGRIWRAVDKANGAQMFYANPSLKFAQVAYRGAWATFGVEFNFPVSHNWVTSSPVDYALTRDKGGSAAIVVGNIDLVHGMQWRVELRLRPGRAVLEQSTALYNRSDTRHRFYWWTNAAVQSWDDDVLAYPMEFTATHGFTRVDTWPTDSTGADLSRPGNHRAGAVSLFSHATREPFMGVWHPRTGTGVAHWADPAELPAKKVWSWGVDAEGLDWRKALSDDQSAEVEIQAGLFKNQETYAFLAPQETVRFREYWMPVRGIGGISRATPEAIVHVGREGGTVTVGVQVTRAVAGGRLRVRDGDRVVVDEALSLSPAEVRLRSYPLAPDRRYAVEIADAAGRVLLAHAEGQLDVTPAAEIAIGPQRGPRVPPREEWTEADFVEQGRALELEGKRLQAWQVYDEGRARFPPGGAALLTAAGRLAVDLARFDEAVPPLQAAVALDTTDAEAQYALGLALAAQRDDGGARPPLESAAHFRATRTAALLQLARIDARAGDLGSARRRLGEAVAADPDAVRAGAMEVIVLRRMGRAAEAARRLAHWRSVDPTSAVLRNEAVRAGAADDALWRHLAGDPQRVLEAAIDYLELGAFDDALLLLDRRYPSSGVAREAGMPLPQEHAEVAYYRAYCRDRMGLDARAGFAAASRLPTTYVFPRRAQTLAVLRRAIEVDPGDATARSLLGSLHLSAGLTDQAIADWEAARALDPTIPVLHRNLGRALIHAGAYQRAREVLAEGVTADPRNVEVYTALDQALGLLGRPAGERAAALAAYPDSQQMPASLVLALAVADVEAGHFDEADALFDGRFFPREEFGTNVRQAWLESRLQRGLALARAGHGDDARRIVATLGDRVPGLDFTASGLPAFLGGARVLYLQGEILAAAGDAEGARRAFEAAAQGGDAYPNPDAAFALLAAKRLGTGEADARARLESALQSWRHRASVGTNYPGANAAGQGIFLRALGRDAEAEAKLREALLLPDKVMSHYLSRRALAGTW